MINERLLQFRVTLAVSGGEVDRSWMWKDAKHWKLKSWSLKHHWHEFSTKQGCLKVCNVLKSWGVGSMPLSGNESVPGNLRWEQASHACPHATFWRLQHAMRHLLWMIESFAWSLSGLLQVRPRAHVFPFDSKVLAPRRGIMHIDRFASHHGWYSGWSESRQGVGQRSRQQCSFPGCKWAARNQLSDVDFRHLKHVFQKWCKEERHCLSWINSNGVRSYDMKTIVIITHQKNSSAT